MKPVDLYKVKPQSIERALWQIIDGYHIPEIDQYDFNYEACEKEGKVETRVYEDYCSDSIRTWFLASIWYQNSPVMIIQNAGRDGQDHMARFITDTNMYRKMVEYLMNFTVTPDSDDSVDPLIDIDSLTRFYGSELIIT